MAKKVKELKGKVVKAVDLTRAKKVLEVVDKGLTSGMGSPQPGFMCVEAAVCYAYGEPHGDQPTCVHPSLRSIKIDLNDSGKYASDMGRGRALRRIAIAQLGSKDCFIKEVFIEHVNDILVELAMPRINKASKSFIRQLKVMIGKIKLGKIESLSDLPFANIVEGDSVISIEDPYSRLRTDIANSNDCIQALRSIYPDLDAIKCTAMTAEVMVQALIRMKSPGCKYLHLAPPKTKLKIKNFRVSL